MRKLIIMILVDNIVSKSIFASVCIGIGGCISTICSSYIVSSLFIAASIFVCISFNLFTCKASILSDSSDVRRLLLVLMLNLFAAFLFGFIVSYCDSAISTISDKIVNSYAEANVTSCMIKSFIMGFVIMLMMNINTANEKNCIIPLLVIFAAAYSSCYHCILDTFYYGASSEFYNHIGWYLLRLLIVIVFNFIGCNSYNLIVKKSFIYSGSDNFKGNIIV